MNNLVSFKILNKTYVVRQLKLHPPNNGMHDQVTASGVYLITYLAKSLRPGTAAADGLLVRRRLDGDALVRRVHSWKLLEKLGRILLLQPPFMLFQWWNLIGHNNKVSYWLRGTSQSQGLLF